MLKSTWKCAKPPESARLTLPGATGFTQVPFLLSFTSADILDVIIPGRPVHISDISVIKYSGNKRTIMASCILSWNTD